MLNDLKTSMRRTSCLAGSLASRELGDQARRLNQGKLVLRSPSRYSPAFTLIEMMIVMGIIVLAVSLAIPAIRILTGSRSEQAAQNTVSAYLASARADAVGLQDIEGVLFYLDPATDRVTCVEVEQSVVPVPASGDVPGVVYLDLVAGVHPGKSRDPLPLPPGIRLMTIKDAVPYRLTYTEPFALGGYAPRYLGYNLYPPATAPMARLGGVILFSGNGRLFTGRYGFRFLNGAIATPLGTLIFGNTVASSNWPSTATTNQALYGQIAFAMYDRETFLNQHDPSGNPFLDNNQDTSGTNNVNPADGPNTNQQDWWLDTNTTPVFVNRYNGTLTRAE
jgi:prepilin-type N-terminal cleavage/methylation domain-containing protein